MGAKASGGATGFGHAPGSRPEGRRHVLSHRVAPAVPSARWGGTTEFGMGSGVSPRRSPPTQTRSAVRGSSKAGCAEAAEAKSLGPLGRLGSKAVARLPPAAYRRRRLRRPFGGLAAHGRTHLGQGFPLRCLQRLSPPGDGYPALPRAGQLVHQRPVRPGPLVLGTASRSPPTPATDTDRTVSRRSEPSSRTALTGEQPDPWDLLQPQDAMSRHRGAKPPRRCGLSGAISLLSPAYLLSVARWPAHAEPPDH